MAELNWTKEMDTLLDLLQRCHDRVRSDESKPSFVQWLDGFENLSGDTRRLLVDIYRVYPFDYERIYHFEARRTNVLGCPVANLKLEMSNPKQTIYIEYQNPMTFTVESYGPEEEK